METDSTDLLIKKIDFNDRDQSDEILDLLKRCFPATESQFTRDWWDWKYRENCASHPLGWGLYDGGSLVSARLLWPMKYNSAGNVMTAYQLVDTVTAPSHQGKGLFTKLLKVAKEEVRDLGSFMFNFPNSNSVHGYLKNGWKRVAENTIVFGVPFFSLSFKKDGGVTVEQITPDTSIVAKGTEATDGFVADESYIRWRYGKHPFKKYFIAQNQHGFIVFRIVLRKGIRAVMVLLTRGKDLKRLLRGIAHTYRPLVVKYDGLNESFIQVFNRATMFRFRKNTNYVAMPIEKININALETGLSDFA